MSQATTERRLPIRDELIKNSKRTFVLFCILASIILVKILWIQWVSKEELLSQTRKDVYVTETIPATRGNILARDGRSLLATSIPKYQVAIDPQQASDELFKKAAPKLARQLARFFGDRSSTEYVELLTSARAEGKIQYLPLGNRLVDHLERDSLRKFELFKEPKLKGGGIFDRREVRFMPFDNMASRTIGRLDPKTNRKGEFGIEYSFNSILTGVDGRGEFQKISGGYLKPLDPDRDTKPIAGQDVVTTLDVNFQDIVESALYKQVVAKGARYGAAVVMEIATGEIRAISNLSRRGAPGAYRYVEDENYVIRGGTDPGSTFKLATMAALLEKAKLDPNSFAVDCPGHVDHRGIRLECSKKHGPQTVQQVMESSCNVGIYRLMQKHFGFERSSEFFDYLQTFRLDQPLGFQLKGETTPIIKNKRSETFSHTTIPWMAIGYESRLTPLQMLAFYNAIANQGKWVQPIIVKEIRETDQIIKTFEANKIPKPIVSEQTVKVLHAMLRGVVVRGTAEGIKDGACAVAGKTGTSQKRLGNGYQKGLYYTAFMGFFPANDPKYSCAIIIDEPQGYNYYAADVAAPVFREIVDQIYSFDLDIHPIKKITGNPTSNWLKNQSIQGYASDLRTLAETWNVEDVPGEMGIYQRNGSQKWGKWEFSENAPILKGMVLRDALALLENQGFRVTFEGIGRVVGYRRVTSRHIHLQLNPQAR